MLRGDGKRPGLIALGSLGIGLLLGSACATNPDHLPGLERSFYYNLDSEADQEAFLMLRKEDDRIDFLKQKGLWDKWKGLSEEERTAVKEHRVEIGFHEFAVHMAWGPPADLRPVDSGERHVDFQIFIKCTSGPNVGDYVRQNIDCDGTSSEVQVAVENDRVTEIKYLD